jgi:hypothetical protein
MSIIDAYDPDTRWGRAFGVVDRVNYSPPLYQHRGQDIRKTDPTGSYSVPTDVISLSAGVVSHAFTARATGREVVVDTGRARGRYEIHCHCVTPQARGSRVSAGQRIARNATASQNPGTGWTAPHDHLVISDYPDAAHTPSRPVYDPRPFIRAALASTAGGGATPFQEDDMYDAEAEQRLFKRLDEQLATRLEDILVALGAGNARTIPAEQQADRSVLAHVRRAVEQGNSILAAVAPVIRNIDGVDTPVPLRQEVADAKTGVLELQGRPVGEVVVDIDGEDIAAALAPLLESNQQAVIEAIQALPAETIAALKAAL